MIIYGILTSQKHSGHDNYVLTSLLLISPQLNWLLLLDTGHNYTNWVTYLQTINYVVTTNHQPCSMIKILIIPKPFCYHQDCNHWHHSHRLQRLSFPHNVTVILAYIPASAVCLLFSFQLLCLSHCFHFVPIFKILSRKWLKQEKVAVYQSEQPITLA